MKSDPESVRKTLLNAQQAMQRGDRQAARRWAEIAVELAPEYEESWLILAALASPRASVKYLEQALKINPQSQRARKGIHWAVERLRHEQEGRSSRKPTPLLRKQVENLGLGRIPQPVSERPAVSEPKTQPRVQKLPVQTVSRSASPSDLLLSKSLATYRWSFLTLFLLAICVTAVWAFWPGNVSPVLAFLHAPRSTQAIRGVLADVNKPTYTPSPSSTFTPTATFTPTPTSTLTPTPTDTPTPTATFTPTDTPWPTETEIPWPTDTEIPWPTNTPEPDVNPSSSGGIHWIDVDLSQQMVYAYEGNTIVASFLVSTGVPAFPTVTGQFHIYMKFVYTDMAGPGYYLPNVPYTMYFYKGYGLHGTYWHNNFGHPMSHGCVNMYTPDAEWLYYWAPMGTLVNVHY
jgi:lipoprotein-anchoring transpeptidase ErfK/SrfK